MSETTQSYFVQVECTNCGWKGGVNIPKGTPIEEFECPQCGVMALVKKKPEKPPEIK
jgi:DNA-directed RNA polymerase subunit RPC12/RpoP